VIGTEARPAINPTFFNKQNGPEHDEIVLAVLMVGCSLSLTKVHRWRELKEQYKAQCYVRYIHSGEHSLVVSNNRPCNYSICVLRLTSVDGSPEGDQDNRRDILI